MSYVALMRKLSRACGSFQNSAQLIARLATPSQVVHRPYCPCATDLTLSSSCSILVTSATTRSFLSFLLALDHRMGGSLHPRPARPVWTMPTNLLMLQSSHHLLHLLLSPPFPSSLNSGICISHCPVGGVP